MTIRMTATILSLCVCMLLSGCASLKTDDKGQAFKWPWQKEDNEPYPNPVKMAVTWTPDILVQPGRTPTRGFGGRVYFYNEKSQAVPVEGDLFVHGFDEAGEGISDPNNAKRYRFTSDQFVKKFSKTDLGASYSIWIPWDAAGGTRRQLSLLPSFKSATGKVIQGEAARLTLPGKTPIKDVARAQKPQNVVRQVGHFVGKPEEHNGLRGSSRLQTTTIPLPKSFQQRLAQMGEQQRRARVVVPQGLPQMKVQQRVMKQPEVVNEK